MKTVSNPDGTVGHQSGEPCDADRCLGIRDCPTRDIHEYSDCWFGDFKGEGMCTESLKLLKVHCRCRFWTRSHHWFQNSIWTSYWPNFKLQFEVMTVWVLSYHHRFYFKNQDFFILKIIPTAKRFKWHLIASHKMLSHTSCHQDNMGLLFADTNWGIFGIFCKKIWVI